MVTLTEDLVMDIPTVEDLIRMDTPMETPTCKVIREYSVSKLFIINRSVFARSCRYIGICFRHHIDAANSMVRMGVGGPTVLSDPLLADYWKCISSSCFFCQYSSARYSGRRGIRVSRRRNSTGSSLSVICNNLFHFI